MRAVWIRIKTAPLKSGFGTVTMAPKVLESASCGASMSTRLTNASFHSLALHRFKGVRQRTDSIKDCLLNLVVSSKPWTILLYDAWVSTDEPYGRIWLFVQCVFG